MQFFKNQIISHYKILVIIFVLSLITHLTLIVNSGLLHNDDYSRVILAYGWKNDGRLLANLIYYLLVQSTLVQYLGSLPQLMALLCYSVVALLVASKMVGKITYPVILMVLPVVVFPYLAENMAFKYDSISMAIALFLSILPFFLDQIFTKKHFIYSIIALLSLLLLYQQAINGYIMMASYLFIKKTLDKRDVKKNIRELFYYIIVLLVTLLVYRILAKTPFIAIDNRSAFLSANPILIIGGVIANIKSYYATTVGWWGQTILGWQMLFIQWAFCITVIVQLVKSKANLFTSFCFVSALIIFMISANFATFFTDNGLLFRYLYSSGIYFSLMMLHLYLSFKDSKINRLVSIFLVYTTISFAVFTTIFEQAIYWHNDFRKIIIAEVANDIDQLAQDYSVEKLYFSGNLGYSPRVKTTLMQYPMLRDTQTVMVENQIRHEFVALNVKPGSHSRVEGYHTFLKKNHPLDDFHIGFLENFDGNEALLVKSRLRWNIYLLPGGRMVVLFKH